MIRAKINLTGWRSKVKALVVTLMKLPCSSLTDLWKTIEVRGWPSTPPPRSNNLRWPHLVKDFSSIRPPLCSKMNGGSQRWKGQSVFSGAANEASWFLTHTSIEHKQKKNEDDWGQWWLALYAALPNTTWLPFRSKNLIIIQDLCSAQHVHSAVPYLRQTKNTQCHKSQ